ncbi:putative lipoprotein [Hyphomonas neptunium ATCC 15444]|uniref:Putative lipoprotein n=2 Tax=Hyphomonas TaxID=85 RepID=Q0BYU1_HYPNA|nr:MULTISPECIES: hypothetical protein [Hyphomonas]ABI78722.1 putative lipoprotein [Hyphomonas neptunium ATCC 15444]KCZ91479.1 putative lipoprotein [Hyphomonas hirschiana VP5]
MIRFRPEIAAALSILALAACAQTGTAAPPVVPSSPQQIAEAAQAPAGWRPFSADSPWNTKIPSDAPVDPGSTEFMAQVASDNALYINIREWTVATYYIDAKTTPKRRVFPIFQTVQGRGFEPGTRIPAPDFATPSGPAGGTEFLAMIDPEAGKAWEMHQPRMNEEDGNWLTTFGAVIDLEGTGVPSPWMKAETPADAVASRPSAIPLIAGLIRLDEIKAGRIDHALAFAYPTPRTDRFVAPAGGALESGPDRPENHFGLPMGARIQLDPSYDIENTRLSANAKIVARALQEYGAILVEEAGATTLFAEGSPAQIDAWKGVLSPGDLQLLFTPEMMRENFRVLELGEQMPGRPEAMR